MSKVFLILAVITALAAAALGYLNGEKFKSTQAELEDTRVQEQAARDEAAKQKKASEAAKAQAQEAEAAKAAAESALASKETELKAARDEAEKIKTEIAAKEQAITDLQVKLDAALVSVSGTSGEPGVAPAPNEVEDLRAQVAELETLKTSLQANLDGAQARVKSLEEAESARVAGLMRKGLEGRILAVNAAYNFVVLSLGDKQGAVANAELLIKRGGTLIGKVRVTSVERGQSIADVVLDSVPRGVRIQPGDVVVFPGT